MKSLLLPRPASGEPPPYAAATRPDDRLLAATSALAVVLTVVRRDLSFTAAAKQQVRLVEILSDHLFPGAARAGMVLAAIGLVAWPRPGKDAAIGIAGGSTMLAATAAASGLYAVNYGRLVLFAAPFAVALSKVLDRPVPLQVAVSGFLGSGSVHAEKALQLAWCLVDWQRLPF